MTTEKRFDGTTTIMELAAWLWLHNIALAAKPDRLADGSSGWRVEATGTVRDSRMTVTSQSLTLQGALASVAEQLGIYFDA